MGTIAEKLNYLNETKIAIKDAIINKGVSVSDIDTFRSYANKIQSIQTGGGSSISSLNDIVSKLVELNTEAQNYFSSIINTYVPKFNTPVTLYTPNANCKNYFIRKRNDTYSIVWTNATAFVKKNSETLLYTYLPTISPYVTYTNSNYGIPIGKSSKDVNIGVLPSGSSDGGAFFLGYISQSFSSLEEAVVGIQSNSTTYTSNLSTAYTIEPVDNKYVFYTNTICDLDSTYLNITMDSTFETNLDIISKNETIEVIE